MQMRKFLLLVLFFAPAVAGYCQFEPLDGFMITQKGDTLYGKIRMDDRANSPSWIRFYGYRGGDGVYRPMDLTAFVIPGYCSYVSREVSVDQRPMDEEELLPVTKEVVRTSTVFLKKLIGGQRASLYYYRDFKDHFFISTPVDPDLKELGYMVGIERSQPGKIQIGTFYKADLWQLACKYRLTFLEKQILEADYTIEDLVAIMRKINSLQYDLSYDMASEKPLFPNPNDWSLLLGVGLSKLRDRPMSANIHPLRTSRRASLMLGTSFRLGRPALKGKLHFRGEVMVYFGGYHATSTDTLTGQDSKEVTISQDNVDVALGAMAHYNPFPRRRWVPYLAVGIQGVYAGNGLPTFVKGDLTERYKGFASSKRLKLSPTLRVEMTICRGVGIVVGRIFHPKSVFTPGHWLTPHSYFAGFLLHGN